MTKWMCGLVTGVLVGAGAAAGQSADPLDTTRVPRLRVSEVTRVGGHDAREDYLFDGVRDVAVLGPDAFVVLDAGSHEARTYGLDGILREKVGGEGEGPGEFVSPSRVSVLPGGRLMVWDGRLQRASVFELDGSVQTTRAHEVGPMALFFSGFAGALPDGSFVQRVNPNPLDLRDEPEGARRDTTFFRHVSAEGEPLGPVVSVLGPRRILVKYDRSSWTREPPIFGRELISAVRNETLLLAFTDSLHVRRFAADGTEFAPLRLRRPVRTAGPRRIEAARAELLADAQEAAATTTGSSMPALSALQRGRVESLRDRPAEETIPAFAGLLVGADGTLWIREYPLPGEPKGQRWFRMGEDFRPDGWFDLPESSRFLAAGHGLLVSVAEDDLDVESVVVHRIR